MLVIEVYSEFKMNIQAVVTYTIIWKRVSLTFLAKMSLYISIIIFPLLEK